MINRVARAVDRNLPVSEPCPAPPALLSDDAGYVKRFQSGLAACPCGQARIYQSLRIPYSCRVLFLFNFNMLYIFSGDAY
jgi:hypothetical protein